MLKVQRLHFSVHMFMGMMVIAAACLALLLGLALPSHAQNVSNWLEPVLIFGEQGYVKPGSAGALDSLSLVSDRSDYLHLFFSYYPTDEKLSQMRHMQLDDRGWSMSQTIFDFGDSIGQIESVCTDDNMLHVIWHEGPKLLYSRVDADNVGLPSSWSKPLQIASSLRGSSIATDGKTLTIGYAVVNQADGSVYMQVSTDGGDNWSEPRLIATSAISHALDDVRVAMDVSHRIHSAWSEYSLPKGWPPTGVYYASSTDLGLTWRPPSLIASGRYAQIGVGTVAHDEVHLLWQSTIGGDGTYHQVALDGGQTWRQPDRNDDRGGLSGPPHFVADAASRMHMITGDGHYAYWSNNQFSGFIDLVPASVRQLSDLSPGERAILAITRGNQLHVVFEVGFRGIWYATQKADISVALGSIVTLTETATIIPIPTRVVAANVSTPSLNSTLSTVVPTLTSSSDSSGRVSSLALVIAAVLALIVTLGLFYLRRSK